MSVKSSVADSARGRLSLFFLESSVFSKSLVTVSLFGGTTGLLGGIGGGTPLAAVTPFFASGCANTGDFEGKAVGDAFGGLRTLIPLACNYILFALSLDDFSLCQHYNVIQQTKYTA